MAGAVLLLPLLACGERKAQAQAPVPTTRTNEQGCTRQRSLGPQDPFQNPPPHTPRIRGILIVHVAHYTICSSDTSGVILSFRFRDAELFTSP